MFKLDQENTSFILGITMPSWFIGYDLKETFSISVGAGSSSVGAGSSTVGAGSSLRTVEEIISIDCGERDTWCPREDLDSKNPIRSCSVKVST